MERPEEHSLTTRSQDYLKAHPGFQAMPSRMQDWILHSPHASEGFGRFFQKGGFIEAKEEVSLPYYHATEPPRIVVSKKDYDALHGPDAKRAIELELSMFTTLAHEIGHDKFNPGAMPFIGQGEHEYVAYRAKLEAGAIFNAFPIFTELKGYGEFQPRWKDIGYAQGGGLGTAAIYIDWSRGSLTDEQAVARLAAPIPNFPYTRQEPLVDQNSDGVLTQRDAYLRDYRLLMQRSSDRGGAQVQGSESAGERRHSVSSSPDHSDHNLYSQIASHVRDQDRQHGRQWDETSERMTASLLALAKEGGLSRVDHVVFSNKSGQVAAGENVFVVQGRLDDPAHLRAHMKTDEAARTPEAVSFDKVEALNERIAQHSAQAQALGQTPDEPSKGNMGGR
ncbi:XVIPCD domain-containing protein [Lysobacter sp. CA199]|uniref:XVIPCD domain-containing protein n=1 Tax=Lysobacter sp. CA199 TaxID=3455608 RepID=UPI003F8D3E68